MRPQEGALQIKFVVLAGLVSVLMGVVLKESHGIRYQLRSTPATFLELLSHQL